MEKVDHKDFTRDLGPYLNTGGTIWKDLRSSKQDVTVTHTERETYNRLLTPPKGSEVKTLRNCKINDIFSLGTKLIYINKTKMTRRWNAI